MPTRNPTGEPWYIFDFDHCHCGDYRKDHTLPGGGCALPNDLTHGFRPCFGFTLWRRADAIPEPYAGTPGGDE